MQRQILVLWDLKHKILEDLLKKNKRLTSNEVFRRKEITTDYRF